MRRTDSQLVVFGWHRQDATACLLFQFTGGFFERLAVSGADGDIDTLSQVHARWLCRRLGWRP
jgi:hypothetical protein